MPTPRGEANAKADAKKAEDVVKTGAENAGADAQDASKKGDENQDVKTETQSGDAGNSGSDLEKANARIAELEKENADLLKQNKDSAEKITELNGDILMKDQIIGDQIKTIEIQEKALTKLEPSDTAIDAGDIAHKVGYANTAKEKFVTVQFLKPHNFSVGTNTINAVKGTKAQLDIFVANKLVTRKLAVIIS